jgi:hypothetical protein
MYNSLIKPLCLLLLLSWAASGCATSSGEHARAQTPYSVYFHGTSTMTSPDGATAYGPPAATLAMREWVGERTITEYAQHGDKAVTATLSRTVEEPLVAIATDATASFNGEIQITEGTWRNWKRWTYKLHITKSSGLLTGEGWMEGDVLKTKKIFQDASGTPRAMIRESLQKISAEEYEKLRATWPTRKSE